MIICSCAVISTEDLSRAVSWMQASDPNVRITPSKLYRALGKEPDCGGCIAVMLNTILATIQEQKTTQEISVSDPPNLRTSVVSTR